MNRVAQARSRHSGRAPHGPVAPGRGPSGIGRSGGIAAAIMAGVVLLSSRPALAAGPVAGNLPVQWIVMASALALALSVIAYFIISRSRRKTPRQPERIPPTADELAARALARAVADDDDGPLDVGPVDTGRGRYRRGAGRRLC